MAEIGSTLPLLGCLAIPFLIARARHAAKRVAAARTRAETSGVLADHKLWQAERWALIGLLVVLGAPLPIYLFLVLPLPFWWLVAWAGVAAAGAVLRLGASTYAGWLEGSGGRRG